MDPLSIATACAGLAGTVGTLVTTLTVFIRDLRTAKGDIETVKAELVSLGIVLEMIEKYLRTPSRQPNEELKTMMSDIVSKCSPIVDEIATCVKSHQQSRFQGPRWVAFGSADMERLRSNLEAHKSLLSLVFNIVSLAATRDIHQETTTVKQNTDTLLVDSSYMIAKTSEILEGIAILQDRLPKGPYGTSDAFILRRYLDDLTSYAGSVCDESELRLDSVLATNEVQSPSDGTSTTRVGVDDEGPQGAPADLTRRSSSGDAQKSKGRDMGRSAFSSKTQLSGSHSFSKPVGDQDQLEQPSRVSQSSPASVPLPMQQDNQPKKKGFLSWLKGARGRRVIRSNKEEALDTQAQGVVPTESKVVAQINSKRRGPLTVVKVFQSDLKASISIASILVTLSDGYGEPRVSDTSEHIPIVIYKCCEHLKMDVASATAALLEPSNAKHCDILRYSFETPSSFGSELRPNSHGATSDDWVMILLKYTESIGQNLIGPQDWALISFKDAFRGNFYAAKTLIPRLVKPDFSPGRWPLEVIQVSIAFSKRMSGTDYQRRFISLYLLDTFSSNVRGNFSSELLRVMVARRLAQCMVEGAWEATKLPKDEAAYFILFLLLAKDLILRIAKNEMAFGKSIAWSQESYRELVTGDEDGLVSGENIKGGTEKRG